MGYEVIRVPLHQTGHATGEYRRFSDWLCAAGWRGVGTSGGHDRGSGWIVAGKRRRVELDLESELHGKVKILSALSGIRGAESEKFL